MAELQLFNDIPVMPVRQLQGHIAIGGPVWPDFAAQTEVRQCRGAGRPVDRCPPLEPIRRRYRRPAIWGGCLDPQFGHLICEHLSRVLPAIRQRPRDIVLFTLVPEMTPETVPEYIWQMLDWLGVARGAVRFVTEPMLAPELRVAPQGETLSDSAPDPAYLDLLDSLPAQNALVSAPRKSVYLSRAGWARRGAGAHLGEGYLVEILRDLGVEVIDPAEISLRDQMAAYHGAAHLIFAEGSAVHGRQLLGRLPQRIDILRRRPNYNTGKAHLTPRCTRLAYHTVCGRLLTASQAPWGDLPHRAASFYRRPTLFAAFGDMGLDIAAQWSEAEYLRHAIADAECWIAANIARAALKPANLFNLLAETDPAIDLIPVALPDAAGAALH